VPYAGKTDLPLENSIDKTVSIMQSLCKKVRFQFFADALILAEKSAKR